MLYGMGTVFVFLTLLVFLLKLLELFVRQFPGQPVTAPLRRAPVQGTPAGATLDPAHRAAIEKAIKLHLKL